MVDKKDDRFIVQGTKLMAEKSERTGLWHMYGRSSQDDRWQLLDKFQGSKEQAAAYLPKVIDKIKE